MDIITNNQETDYQRKAHLFIEDLDEYGQNLWDLIQMYRKHIYIDDPRSEAILQELEYYALQFIHRNYDSVIMNSNEIVMPDPTPIPKSVPF